MFALAALILAASCGGPGMPAAPSAIPSSNGFASGSYMLSFSQTPVFTCRNGICTSASQCVGPVGAATSSASSAAFQVIVQRDGDRATVTSAASGDTFHMSLLVGGSQVTGTVSGTAIATSGASVVVSGTVIGVGT